MKRHVLLLMIGLSTASVMASSVEHVPAISLTSLQNLDIQHYVQDNEINILSLNDSEYVTLMKEETSGFPRGIAFIVPDINQPITRQPAIKKLYDDLTEYGWRSLMLTMPNINEASGSENDIQKTDPQNSQNPTDGTQQRNTNSDLQQNVEQEAAGESDSQTLAEPNLKLKAFHQPPIYNDDTFTAMQQQILIRVQTAWEFAQQYPGYFVFVCQGQSCAWLTSLFQQQKLMQPDALVMLSAHVPQLDLNQSFAQQISETEFPVLELFKQVDNQWVLSAVKHRKKLARKHYKTDYRQRQLSSHIAFGDNNERTVKEVYGFLTAVGM